MGFINFIAELLKDPRTAIASWTLPARSWPTAACS